MLRVGLTGGLGSGKSTVTRMLAARGAHVLSSDAIGRELMQPGEPVFAAVLDRFGAKILNPHGALDRAVLARLVFDRDHPERLEALNAIVHPAVIARQAELIEKIAAESAEAVVVVESALLFETKHAGAAGWQARFDRIVLVRAADEGKVARYVQRTLGDTAATEAELARLAAEAHRRLSQQLPDEEKARHADYILVNDGSLADLERQVAALWPTLEREARRRS